MPVLFVLFGLYIGSDMMKTRLCVAVNVFIKFIFILYQRFIYDKHREFVNFGGSLALFLSRNF